MSLRINLNTAAMTAHRLLADTDGQVGKTIERLSSGFKINSAADDPAGLVISEKLRAQIGGLGQAIRNAGDAVNMVRTAEAALNEVSRLLQSMRNLAVHAANTGATDDASRTADQMQVTNAIASLDKIAEETQFGQKKLLDGSAGIKAIVTGAAVTSGNLTNATTLTQDDIINITITQAATKASLTSADFGADDTAAIGATGTFLIGSTSIDYTAVTTVTQLAAAINAVSDDTGVVATLGGTGEITFSSVDYGSDSHVSITAGIDILIGGAASAAAIGIDVEANVTISGGGNVSDATWQAGDGTQLKDSLGNTIDLTVAGATALGALNSQFQIATGSMRFQVGAYAGQIRELNLPSVYATDLISTTVPGESVATIDLLSNPDDALRILDDAITSVTSIRAELGATQKNVFESSITSLTIAKENIQASESTIRDTDMAMEVVNLSRNQILQQAGTAMLAQANQTPQILLKLLQ